jgi:PAB-dependent poly(A)-specific ribonuclease subunit 2
VFSPLNSIGLPYYREVLASAWPDIVSDVGAPPVKYTPQFLSGLKSTDFGLYGRNSRGLRRNQVEDTRSLSSTVNTGLKAPKFLSEKARESARDTSTDDKAEDITSTTGEVETDSKKLDVPVMYRNVEIKYSKFGVDDFDFGYGNNAVAVFSCHAMWLTCI